MASRKSMQAAARAFGRKGGKASAEALTPEERRARAKAAIAVRWASKETMPIDQLAVMNRLPADGSPVELRIAPGAGGKRRRAAIGALAKRGQLEIVDEAEAVIFVRRR